MSKLLIFISIIAFFGLANAPAYAEIARWTDEDGKVHFGNPQFAPAGSAEVVEVQAANGMVVPEAAVSRPAAAPPKVAYIKKASKRNERGWRGFHKRKKAPR